MVSIARPVAIVAAASAINNDVDERALNDVERIDKNEIILIMTL